MVDDIGLILRGLIKDSEYSLATNGTTTAHCLVEHDGTGIIASAANSIKVIGAESRGLGTTTGLPITFKTTGITPVATLGKLEVGKNVKAGPEGKAVRMIDSGLISAALGGGEYTTIAGLDFANQPASDSVDTHSASGADIGQTVTVYGKLQAGTLDSETLTLNGANVIAGAKVWANIHAVVISAAHAGTVTVEEHSGHADIVTLATGTLSKGRLTATDPRAHCGKIGVTASGATTKVIGVRGKNLTGAAASEEIALNGAAVIPSVNDYSEITTIDIGDAESTVTVSALVRATEDDEHVKLGVALTGATVAGDIYVALK